MKKAIFAGSFDPPTVGHFDVIERSLKVFDKIFVAVLKNPKKTPFFNLEQRLSLLEKISDKFEHGRVEVISFEGLLVDLAESLNVCTIVRGVRDNYDLKYEINMADINRRLNKKIETVFLPTKPENLCVSSENVRQILSFKGDISGFVPECILDNIKNIVRRNLNES